MEDDPEQIPDHQLGKLQFSIDYDFQKAELSCGVIQASDLPGVDMSGSTDPYIKLYILPDKRKRLETKVHRKTLNPVFNETFYFKVKYEVIASKTLVFAIYDFDRFSAHDLIGMVKVKLCDVDLGRVLEEWRDICPAESDDEKAKELGEICFSLTYVPSSEKLTFVIVEAKNLKKLVDEKKKEIADDDSEEEVTSDLKTRLQQQVQEKRRSAIASAIGKVNKLKRVKTDPDPFVKITMTLPGGTKLKHKTTMKKGTANPYFNESVSFDISMEQVQKLSCAITVVDHERIGTSDTIGRVTLGCNASGNELRHWSDMLANPRRSIAQWHKLVEVPVRGYLK